MASVPATVLLIDDDPVFRGFLAAWLKQSGFRARVATRGSEGLALIQAETPDLVLCDLQMPDLNGLDVLRQLTKTHPTLPVIMVSGASRIADVVEALRLGAWDYLLKPINDLNQLHTCIMDCLKRGKARQQSTAQVTIEHDSVEFHTNLLELSESPQFGRRVQRELLPPPQARFGPLQVGSFWLPIGEISGDFLDFFPLDGEHLAFYVVDVSGHGPAAAFMTVLLKSLLNAPLRAYQRAQDTMLLAPEAVLTYLNREICRLELGHSLNITFGVIDVEACTLRLSSGAHFPPALRRHQGQWQCEPVESMSLGMVSGMEFSRQEYPFEPGDQLILSSDGIFPKQQREQPECLNWLRNHLASQPLALETWDKLALAPARQDPSDDISTIFVNWPV